MSVLESTLERVGGILEIGMAVEFVAGGREWRNLVSHDKERW